MKSRKMKWVRHAVSMENMKMRLRIYSEKLNGKDRTVDLDVNRDNLKKQGCGRGRDPMDQG
jgi:hypothetical protein